jgi:hypothetical protein
MACVWSFQYLPELKNELGFVECDDELAELLIASGRAQDPRIGATPLTHLTTAAPPPLEIQPLQEQSYDDKAMIPKRRK